MATITHPEITFPLSMKHTVLLDQIDDLVSKKQYGVVIVTMNEQRFPVVIEQRENRRFEASGWPNGEQVDTNAVSPSLTLFRMCSLLLCGRTYADRANVRV